MEVIQKKVITGALAIIWLLLLVSGIVESQSRGEPGISQAVFTALVLLPLIRVLFSIGEFFRLKQYRMIWVCLSLLVLIFISYQAART